MRRITGTFTEGEAMNQRNDCKDRLFVIAIPGVSHKDFCTICAKNNLLCFLHIVLRPFLLSTVVLRVGSLSPVVHYAIND